MNVPGLAHPTALGADPRPAALRVLLALAVVFIMLATTGWTAVHRPEGGTPLRTAALGAWAKAHIDGRPVPPANAPARTVARFFAGLDGAQQARLVDGYPLVVGNLDGVPPAVRYRANLKGLEQARRVDEARSRDVALTPADRATATRRSHRFASLAEPGRQILVFDPTGDGRVAEVFGDLARAERVSVIVPGVDTDLLTFERTQRRLTSPVGMAESLYEAQRTAEPDRRTAVIAWAGYTAPTGVGMDAATGRMAVDGAVLLKDLTTTLPGDSSVALFCHSYGSVVCGVAAHELAAPGDRRGGGGQPRDARGERGRAAHLGARLGDPRRGRLDRGRSAPGGRRAGPRRRSGVPGVRRAAAVLGPGQEPHRLFRARDRLDGQLRPHRNRCVRFRCLRDRGRCLSARNFRDRAGLTRVEARKTGPATGGTRGGAALYDVPHG